MPATLYAALILVIAGPRVHAASSLHPVESQLPDSPLNYPHALL